MIIPRPLVNGSGAAPALTGADDPNREPAGTMANNTIRFRSLTNISIPGGSQSFDNSMKYQGDGEWVEPGYPNNKLYFETGYWYITQKALLDQSNVIFRASGTINSDPSSLTYAHAPGSTGSGGSWAVSAISGTFAGNTIPGTYIGQFYRDTTNGLWYIWNGTTWDQLTITAP
jgi:hypothetical protein